MWLSIPKCEKEVKELNDELYHHGVKGMKWGVRRYQNADGSLTSAGKKRAARDMADLSNNKKKSYTPNTDKWVKEDLGRSRRLVDESSNMANKLKNANDLIGKKRSKTKMDLSSMTDQEMRNQINRALLERQYNDMFSPQKTSKGREYVSDVLDVAGTALGIGSSALGIALAIKELKG